MTAPVDDMSYYIMKAPATYVEKAEICFPHQAMTLASKFVAIIFTFGGAS